MNRRTLLKWICRGLAVACSSLVAVPGVGYVIAPLFKREKKTAIVQRLVKLDDLTVDKPERFAVTGSRQDAWTHYPEQTLGRVWLLRRSATAAQEQDVSKTQVDAYTSECPHLGCEIILDRNLQKGEKQGFFCPCHKASWDLEGKRKTDEKPTTRSMDTLTCRLVQDEAQVWWVEVEYVKFHNNIKEKIIIGSIS